jgi:hypothetical protein
LITRRPSKCLYPDVRDGVASWRDAAPAGPRHRKIGDFGQGHFDLERLPKVKCALRQTVGMERGCLPANPEIDAGETEFIVGYSQWWGWFGRPVAVPLEALGIEGGHLVSLGMSPSEFAAAPTWRDTDAPPLPNDAIVRVALSRS